MSATRTTISAVLAIAVLALALLSPAGALAASGRTVAVSAEATLKVPNDAARLGFGVSVVRKSRGTALRAVSARLRQVIAAVKAILGVEAGDVSTGRIGVRKVRGRPPRYRAGEGVSVVLHQPKRAGELVEAALHAGASGVSGPVFFVGDPEAAYAKALARAFEKAKARAAILAREAGATLGPVLTIVEGGAESEGEGEFTGGFIEAEAPANVPPPPPVKPGSSTVTATVRVVFELL